MSDLFISGYASRFDEADLSGDIVRRGAFSAALLARIDPFPMLFGHKTNSPIGVWDRVVEDEQGLFVAGRILDDTDSSRRLVATRAVSGLSIGYRTKRSVPRTGGGRILTEIDLWEVSVVAFPMLRSARITQIGDPSETDAPHTRRTA
ncbi:MAG: HK97 family phage prohead protease [Litorimonas sp.]